MDKFGYNLLNHSRESLTIVRDIPRFVSDENYASSFGEQWKAFQKTQLDSYTGTQITRDRLTRMAGGNLGIFEGKTVLEAGCGAGRFTEILLDAGASVFAVDISNAVEANYQNCGDHSRYFVCQADILDLPVDPEQFDIVVCIGVVQHTPNPEETMTALCSHVKPGGLLIMDHYHLNYPATTSRRFLRSFLKYMPASFTISFCRSLVALLWPLHRLMWTKRHSRIGKRLYPRFIRLSPVVDYQPAYMELGLKLLRTWAILDTHDTLTDFYKHLRSAEQIESHLKSCGMVDVEVTRGGNGIEARARKPL